MIRRSTARMLGRASSKGLFKPTHVLFCQKQRHESTEQIQPRRDATTANNSSITNATITAAGSSDQLVPEAEILSELLTPSRVPRSLSPKDAHKIAVRYSALRYHTSDLPLEVKQTLAEPWGEPTIKYLEDRAKPSILTIDDTPIPPPKRPRTRPRCLRIHEDEHTRIVTIALHNGAKNNFNLSMFVELNDWLRFYGCQGPDKYKGIIITSLPRQQRRNADNNNEDENEDDSNIFSAGFDIKEMYRPDNDRFRQMWDYYQELFMILNTFPLPTIACINGHALSVGCHLALWCDYRIMCRYGGDGTDGADADAIRALFLAPKKARALPASHSSEQTQNNGITTTATATTAPIVAKQYRRKANQLLIGPTDPVMGFYTPEWIVESYKRVVRTDKFAATLLLDTGAPNADTALGMGLIDAVYDTPSECYDSSKAMIHDMCAAVPYDVRQQLREQMRYFVLQFLSFREQREEDGERALAYFSHPEAVATFRTLLGIDPVDDAGAYFE